MSQEWKRCTQCVISAAFPRIDFDDKGVCSFCRDQAFYIAENDTIDQARTQVTELFSSRLKSGRYDALVCLSGGKDSTYTLMLAVRTYGLRTLAFTFDNGFLSEFAFDNIRCAVNALGVDHVTVRPSFETMKSIVRASAMHQIYAPRTLTRISAVCNSCITMVNTMAVSLALEKQIPFVIAGFTLGQIPSNAVVYRPNQHFIQESRVKAVSALEKHSGRSLTEYFSVSDELLNLPSPWYVNLLCLESISEDRLIEEVIKIGWRQPDDVDGCSSNCKLNAFNNYAHELAYGYNPYELELSHLIRKKLLTREQALKKLDEKSSQQLDSIIAELGITHSDIKTATSMLGAVTTGHRGNKIDEQK
jgi:tRNA(Ile)-lysidine synthase TilS/MesJ